MDASQRDVEVVDVRPGSVLLWIGILAGPLAWAADLQARYALVGYVCRTHAEWLMWLISALALLITGGGATCSWLGWIDDSPRVRFMAAGGLLIGAAFALAIIAMAIPDVLLRACD